MASFTQFTDSVAIIAALATLPNQTDGLTAAQLKAKFDEAAGLIKTYLNSTLIAELEAQGAADKVGAVVGGVAGSVQDFIDAVELAGTGTLPPVDSITWNMLTSAVQTLIGTANGALTTHKTSTDHDGRYYTETESDATFIAKTILSAAGDLMGRDGSGLIRIPKGTAYQALGMNSDASAQQWLATLQSLMTAAGDIIYASGANTPTRLGKGTDGQILTLVNGLPIWSDKLQGYSTTGGDSSSTIARYATLNKDVPIGFTPKFAIVTVRNGNGLWNQFIITPSGGLGMLYFNGSQVYSGNSTAIKYESGGTPSWIYLNNISFSGNNVRITFINDFDGDRYLNASWYISAIG